jgi:5-methylcytosine-specific restriction endonuclease McrA
MTVTRVASAKAAPEKVLLSLGSRHVPAAVRRAVWTRDGGRCAFVSANGRRCTARGFIEFHHTAPYAAGGEATADNIELRCRAHNLYEGALDFGPAVRRHATSARAASAQ